MTRYSSKTQNSIITFGYVDSYATILLILYPPLENSTIHIAILYIECSGRTEQYREKTDWQQPFSRNEMMLLLAFACGRTPACLGNFMSGILCIKVDAIVQFHQFLWNLYITACHIWSIMQTHGQRTSRESFFSKILNFWAWADKLG